MVVWVQVEFQTISTVPIFVSMVVLEKCVKNSCPASARTGKPVVEAAASSGLAGAAGAPPWWQREEGGAAGCASPFLALPRLLAVSYSPHRSGKPPPIRARIPTSSDPVMFVDEFVRPPTGRIQPIQRLIKQRLRKPLDHRFNRIGKT